MLCLLVSHFNFQLLPTGSIELILEAAQQIATVTLSALLTDRGQYFFGSSGSVQGHYALQVHV